MATPDVFSLIIAPLISAVSGLGGVGVGGGIASRNQKKERQQRFIRDQLTEFYAPLLGMRERLRAGGEIRLKVRTAAGAEWPRLVAEAREHSLDRLRELEEQRWPEYARIIEDDNRKLETEDIPQYRQMVDLFTSKMHFAEPTTRQHFGALVEFVELWERCLRGALTGEVVKRIGPDEENLSGLYEDLEANFTRLQEGLKK
jgi:hypothetical protein